jgi:hypothetical protein
VRTVLLHGAKADGRVVEIDDADYELVAPYRWTLLETARPHPTGPYARAHQYPDGERAEILMHTLLTGWPRVDHCDGNGLNNQRQNLRPATASQNGANRRPVPGHSSQYKGVGWNKRSQRWRARIRFQGELRYLGSFADEVVAAKTYDAAARELFGAYARPNFPATHAA